MSATQENIVAALQKKIRERMNEHADHMSTGNCKDFEEYKFLTGIISIESNIVLGTSTKSFLFSMGIKTFLIPAL